MLKKLFSSKKFCAAVAGVLVAIIGATIPGLELSTAELTAVIAPIMAYIVGQSAADVGKEKAIVEQTNKNEE